jgi:transcriptional regulator with XRE-family HTH domain
VINIGRPNKELLALHMITSREIRSKRAAAGISATVLAKKAGIHRSRLSFIEHGHIESSPGELQRLGTALDKLITQKRRVRQFAEEVGFPVGALL